MGRFNPKGVEKWLFFPDGDLPADLTAITQTEVNAVATVDMTGVQNSEALFNTGGWTSSPSTINTPDIKSTETGNVEGDSTRSIATTQYYLDKIPASNVIYTTFVKGTSGVMVKAPMGTAAAAFSDAIPCTVTLRELDDAANAAKSFTISWSQGTATAGVFAA